jgi:hypothetical protein
MMAAQHVDVNRDPVAKVTGGENLRQLGDLARRFLGHA